MRLFQSILAAAALASVVSIAPAALAERAGSQAGAAIVVNTGRLIQTSDVGRDMTSKLNAIQQQMATELQPERTRLQSEQTALQTATQGKSEAQIRADAALSARINAFQQMGGQFQAHAESLSNDFEYTQSATLQDFMTQIQPIVREVMEARGAAVVVASNAVVVSSPTADATDDIVARLNQRLRTINVTRQHAPQDQGGQQAAAPAAAAPAPAAHH
jgi:Skp family chaperone for outer membrane proteins